VIVLRALSAIDLFAVLPPAEREHLAQLAVIRRFEAKETLFDEGQPCEGIWIVANGSVRIYKITPGGRQIVLAVQDGPATVAEVPVFDGGPYPATVITQEPCEAMLIRRDDFLACCRRNPELTMKFLAVFSARLRHLVAFVERVTFGSVRQRLAQTLIEMADTAGKPSFAMPETHEDLANRLGTVREVVSRNLGRFQSEGLIRMNRRDLQILDQAGLAAEAATNS
jgi:CRP/FNR family transcriptional regulator